MRHPTFIIVILFLSSCHENNLDGNKTNSKKLNIPDTSNNWYAKLYDYPNYKTKNETCRMLGLPLLENDTSEFSIRVWTIGSNYDPKKIYLLNKIDDAWTIQTVMYSTKLDKDNNLKIDSLSLQRDNPKLLASSDIEALSPDKLWGVPTQSKMKDGEKYGCMDGRALLIEISDKSKYQFTSHMCPSYHVSKDSTFKTVDTFDSKMRQLANR